MFATVRQPYLSVCTSLTRVNSFVRCNVRHNLLLTNCMNWLDNVSGKYARKNSANNSVRVSQRNKNNNNSNIDSNNSYLIRVRLVIALYYKKAMIVRITPHWTNASVVRQSVTLSTLVIQRIIACITVQKLNFLSIRLQVIVFTSSMKKATRLVLLTLTIITTTPVKVIQFVIIKKIICILLTIQKSIIVILALSLCDCKSEMSCAYLFRSNRSRRKCIFHFMNTKMHWKQ